MKEFELEVPERIEVRMVENTNKIINFTSDELSDDQLAGAAGGSGSG